MTRANLTQGSLLTVAQFDTAISNAQAANQLSGVINFSGGTGTATGNSFTGNNTTGTLTFTSNITFTNSQVTSRSFTAADSVGSGNLNSAPINGGGMLNVNSTTWTLSTAVDYIGFTQLQRDGSRSYSWSVRITDGFTPTTISLGSINFQGAPASMTSGNATAGNYRYDTFVGYQAPSGFQIDQFTISGGFMNVDSFAYAMIPEPSTAALLGVGLIGFLLARRRKAKL
jgi:hypothetical protein